MYTISIDISFGFGTYNGVLVDIVAKDTYGTLDIISARRSFLVLCFPLNPAESRVQGIWGLE